MPSSFDSVTLSPVFFAEEHHALRRQVRRFVEEEIKPAGDRIEAAGMVPRSLLRQMGDLGFLGIRYPETYGGSGMDEMATMGLAEGCGRSTCSGTSITALVHTDMASVHLFNAGTEAQKARYMPGIVSGDLICGVAVTEPQAGSDVKGIRTTARRDGNEYVLNGSKMFITNAIGGDLLFVAARSDHAAPPAQGISVFIVEKGTLGYEVVRRLDKMGWHSSDTAELSFQDCRIPAENLLGEEGRGFHEIMKNFQNERLVLGALAMGEAQAALDLALDYARTRTLFGGTLWDRDGTRQKIACLASKVEAGRHLVLGSALRLANGETLVREVSMIKAFCGELINEVMYGCLQLFGGAGYMRGTPIERMYRDARVHAIGGGATEVMLEEVAKRL